MALRRTTIQVNAVIVASAMITPLAVVTRVIATEIAAYRVESDRIVEPLDGAVGDAARGRKVVLSRETGNCLICHRVPEPGEAFQGTIGPPLDGVGGRLNAGQLRLRLVDQTKLNPETVMPPYYRIEGLTRVAARYRGKPVLTAQEIEDAVAYLLTLK